MSLRFFSDQCVPSEITDILRRHGHQLMERLAAFLDGHPTQKFYHGKLLLIAVHRVRIRH